MTARRAGTAHDSTVLLEGLTRTIAEKTSQRKIGKKGKKLENRYSWQN